MRRYCLIKMIFLCFFIAACSDEPVIQAERPAPVAVSPVSAGPAIESDEAVSSFLEVKKQPVVSYNGVGRRDPFRSIVALSEGRPKSVKTLPPLQRNEVSDLRLQGIIWGEYGPRAIVNTPDGKGYTVRVGTPVGFNRGVIKRITQNQVIIEETLLNIFGEPKKRSIVMELHPEKEG